MQHLVEEPDDLGCRGAMIETQEHLDAFSEEGPAKIRWNRHVANVNLLEPLGVHVHCLEHGGGIERPRLAKSQAYHSLQKFWVGQERL